MAPDGLLAGWRPDAVMVEMSTVSPAVVAQLAAKVAARGGAPCSTAPVSGSTITLERASSRSWSAATPAVLDGCAPTCGHRPAVTHVGALGLAKRMKVATNLGLAVQMLAFTEAVLLAEKAGIPRERAVEALLKSVIASPW